MTELQGMCDATLLARHPAGAARYRVQSLYFVSLSPQSAECPAAGKIINFTFTNNEHLCLRQQQAGHIAPLSM